VTSQTSFTSYRFQRLSGFDRVDASTPPDGEVGGLVEADDFPEFFANVWQWTPARGGVLPHQVLACTGSIDWSDFSAVGTDIANVGAAMDGLSGIECFMTSISPATYAPPNLQYPSEDASADAMNRSTVDARVAMAKLRSLGERAFLATKSWSVRVCPIVRDETTYRSLGQAARASGACATNHVGMSLPHVRHSRWWCGFQERTKDRPIHRVEISCRVAVAAGLR
jgi:hypothetical protein